MLTSLARAALAEGSVDQFRDTRQRQRQPQPVARARAASVDGRLAKTADGAAGRAPPRRRSPPEAVAGQDSGPPHPRRAWTSYTPRPSLPYSPECVKGAFPRTSSGEMLSELRREGILGSPRGPDPVPSRFLCERRWRPPVRRARVPLTSLAGSPLGGPLPPLAAAAGWGSRGPRVPRSSRGAAPCRVPPAAPPGPPTPRPG